MHRLAPYIKPGRDVHLSLTFTNIWGLSCNNLYWLSQAITKSNILRKLTHWGRDKMDAISQKTFSSAFSWMKMFEFRLKFRWSLFLRVQLTIFQHWFRLWLGADQATSHYLNQWWLDYRRIYASLGLNELIKSTHSSFDTLRSEQNGWYLADNIFNMFCWMKPVVFWFQFHMILFQGVQLILNQHQYNGLVRVCAYVLVCVLHFTHCY